MDESYPAAARSSAYTSLKPADCRIVEENADEAGYSRRNCAGVGGYQVETTESDLRQGLTVIATGGGRTDIPLSATVARGAFNSLGPRGEWRGPTGLAPDTLIVRLNVADGTGAKADISKLVVIRLVPTPCVLAVVGPGPRQNHQARELADTRSGCLGS